MGITVEQSDVMNAIRLEGEVNINSATELKARLVQAIASGKELRLELKGAPELDITALQLLWAAEREARGSGVSFTLVGTIPEEITAEVVEAGFVNFPVQPRTR